ncbi:hypothetical protein KP79_PYT23340 [Mizuhopecten yessoensis]|uniref:Uncharacterized protein n=1 Tax=Mizuhopecten yessoensis TaxID=6573 RepID=A0A210PQ21_MIZYE|nr:hypothetical protein KP79_PYT23340 [Mizuhopecten yessoensis]
MEKILVFCLLVGAVAFVIGQGGGYFGGGNNYYYPTGQYGNVAGYPLGEYLRAKNVYLRARLSSRKEDGFLGDIIGLGALFLLYAFYKNLTKQYIG